jgi:hypothetical protein
VTQERWRVYATDLERTEQNWREKLLTVTAFVRWVTGGTARLPQIRERGLAALYAANAFDYPPCFFVHARVPADWQLRRTPAARTRRSLASSHFTATRLETDAGAA